MRDACGGGGGGGGGICGSDSREEKRKHELAKSVDVVFRKD